METAQVALWAVVMLVALAIAFDFMNGFHDAANSIATVVSTGVLRPTQAVVFAACFNLLAVAAPTMPPMSACEELLGMP